MNGSAQDATDLAQLFFALSDAIDQFRLNNFNDLSAAEQQDLKDKAQASANLAQQFNAQALGAILQSIQPNLGNIKQGVQSANGALTHLKDVAKGLAIISAGIALAGSIASGNLTAIGTNVQSLITAIQGTAPAGAASTGTSS
jgi:hypothetical protein